MGSFWRTYPSTKNPKQVKMRTPPTPAAARLELSLLNAQAATLDSQETYVFLQESGFSPDAAIRLRELLEVTRRIGDKVISIGKIVVMKLIEFAKANPNLAAGVALGAAISVLASSLPILGQILAPLAGRLGGRVDFTGVRVANRRDVCPREFVRCSREFFKPSALFHFVR